MFKSIKGREGVIRIVALGAVIGQTSSWELTREKVGDESTAFFTFRAQLQYINPALFGDTDYHPKVFVTTGKDPQTRKPKQYRLEQAEGRKTSLEGRSLLMEGVKLCLP